MITNKNITQLINEILREFNQIQPQKNSAARFEFVVSNDLHFMLQNLVNIYDDIELLFEEGFYYKNQFIRTVNTILFKKQNQKTMSKFENVFLKISQIV